MIETNGEKISATLVSTEITGFATLADLNITVLDIERNERGITIVGWYNFGEREVHQVFFLSPILAEKLRQLKWFRETFLQPNQKLAIYNVSHEAELLNLDPNKCIELMPYKRCAKERFIKIESLSVERSQHLPEWSPSSVITWGKHNLSCVIKESILMSFNFAMRPGFLIHYEKVLEKKGGKKNRG